MEHREWRERFEDLKQRRPDLADRVCRRLIKDLQDRGVLDVEALDEEVAAALKTGGRRLRFDANRPAPRMPSGARRALHDLALSYAERYMAPEEILSSLLLMEKRQLAYEVSRLAEDQDTPLEALRGKIQEFLSVAPGENIVPKMDVMGTRAALIRRLLTDQLDFIAVAKHFIKVSDISRVLDHIVPTTGNQGRLGGKAAGLILARCILERAVAEARLDGAVVTPETYYIPSNGILEFIEHNGLEELINIKYMTIDEVRREYPLVQRLFKSGEFPPVLHQGLQGVLDRIGEGPLVVRSSSLLEDRIGHAFSGKYKSLFLANTGSLGERLEELENAIAEVYASIFGPDPIEYRFDRGLLDFQEQMGIMIQRVVGREMNGLFLPAFGGVAFSRCEMRWSPRIRRTDGMARLVVGLGTRAVDRTVDDYPVLVALEQPQLRASQQPDEVYRYSQAHVDLIDLDTHQFETEPLPQLLERVGRRFPMLPQIFSIYRDRQIVPLVGVMTQLDPEELVVTFDGLLRSPFPRRLKRMLDLLEEGLGAPVDIEIAHDGDDLYILQCRALSLATSGRREPIPSGIPAEDVVFSANRYVNTAQAHDLEYIVLVDPRDYEQLPTEDAMRRVATVVGALNKALPKRRFILMGPGRWGSRGDIRLGVPVTYSDICHTALLVEIARRKGSYVPDVSFGTHFFQDLVEAGIAYLPLYPDDPDVVWNEAFLRGSPSVLGTILPEYEALAGIVRVIHVPEAAGGRLLHVVMDGEEDRALAWVGPPSGS